VPFSHKSSPENLLSENSVESVRIVPAESLLFANSSLSRCRINVTRARGSMTCVHLFVGLNNGSPHSKYPLGKNLFLNPEKILPSVNSVLLKWYKSYRADTLAVNLFPPHSVHGVVSLASPIMRCADVPSPDIPRMSAPNVAYVSPNSGAV